MPDELRSPSKHHLVLHRIDLELADRIHLSLLQ
jgi:hypothetical protein